MGEAGPDLVGRASELERLLAAFDRRRHRDGPTSVVVHGRAGVGVSALLDGFVAELERRRLPHHVWWGRSGRGGDVAYAPLAALVQRAPGGAAEWLREAAALSGSLADAAPTALLVGLASRLRAAAEEAPLVAIVDSLDGVDASTQRLVSALPALLDDARVLLVLAGRSGASGDPPIGLAPALVEELTVRPPDDNDLRELVRRTAPDLPTAHVDVIVRAAGGRPGLAIQLASSPDPLEPIVGLLTRAGPLAARLVHAADLAGGALTVDLAAVVVDGGADVLAATVDVGAVQLEERRDGPRVVVPAGAWWIDAARQVEPDVAPIARALAQHLDATASPALLAHLWEQADSPSDAAARHIRAADDAVADGAIASAAQHLRRAAELAPASVGIDDLRRAAHLALAATDWAEADTLAGRALGMVDRDDSPTRISLLVLQHRARFEGALGEADQPLDDALAEVTGPDLASVEALVLDAYRRVFDDAAAARHQVERAIALARELDDVARATALQAAGVIASLDGDPDGAIAHADAALAAAARSGDPMVSARAASNHVYVLWRAGRPRDVERVARHELGRLAAAGLPWLGDQLAVARSVALATMGRLDDAQRAIEAARTIRSSADAGALLDLLDAEIALVRGDDIRAERLIAEVASGPSADDPTVSVELALRRAELELARNDRQRAARAARDGLTGAAPTDDLGRARLTTTALRAGAEVDEQVGPDASGREVAALLTEAAALRSPSTAAFRAAAAAWAAVPAPIAELRCLLDAAVADRSLDDVGAIATRAADLGAGQLAEQAAAAWRALGGRRPPSRTTGTLTERETEVLALVARGLTNKEVAAELGISPKTVAVHLERCLAKLGATTRGAAVHEARRAGLLSA